MKKLTLIIGLVILTLFSCSKNPEIKRTEPKSIEYIETLHYDDNSAVYRHSFYSLDSVRYDTVYRHSPTSQILPPTQVRGINHTLGRVDLNDVFGDCDPNTDWNFTEIDEEGEKYLDSLGIYWNDSYGCYMKRK